MKDEKTTANAVASATIDFSRVCGHHARRISLAIKASHFQLLRTVAVSQAEQVANKSRQNFIVSKSHAMAIAG
jgi:hypothetical protein